MIKKIFHKIIYLMSLWNKNKTKVSKTAIINNRKLVQFGKNSEVQDYVIIKTFKNIVSIGENSQINPFTVIYGGAGVEIGNNVMIAPHCAIAAGTHDFIQVDKPMRLAGSFDKGPIVIEDDVWVGANCTITDGVRIGRGAVVGANSVVTKNVDPYDIVGGTPARKIRNRMDGKNDQFSRH